MTTGLASARAIRLAHVDDHETVRLGFAWLVGNEPDLSVVASGSTVDDIVTELDHIDLVILDIRLSDGSTITHNLDVLHAHAPELRVDAVVADPTAVEDVAALAARSADLGARLLLRQVSRGDGTARHDPLRLAAAYSDVLDGFLGDVGRREIPPE